MNQQEHLSELCRLVRAGQLDDASTRFAESSVSTDQGPAEIQRQLASKLLRAGKILESGIVFEHLRVTHPDRPDGWVGKARLAQTRGDWGEALALWRELLSRFDTGGEEVWEKHRADALLNLKRFEEANDAFHALAQKYPERIWGCIGMARVSARSGQWESALEHWDRCFRLFPDQVQPWWYAQRARVLSNLGMEEQARKEIKKAHGSDAATAYYSMIEAIQGGSPNSAQSALNFGSILVVSYGRSGSTLLQGILNSIDGVLVRGENHNVFHYLYRMYRSIEVLKRDYAGAVMPNQAWYGIGSIRLEQMMSVFQNAARTILLADRVDDPNIRCYGFKEVRYGKFGDGLGEYLDFLSGVFPDLAIVFNTRNIDDVVRSGWWGRQESSAVREQVERLERRFVEYASSRSNCFRIAYEDVVSKSRNLRALFEFLGAAYAEDRIDTVLSAPHSYSPTQDNVRKLRDEF